MSAEDVKVEQTNKFTSREQVLEALKKKRGLAGAEFKVLH